MQPKLKFGIFLAIAAVFAGSLSGPAPKISYKDVKPIFDAKCVGCHHGARAQAQFHMDSYAAIMKGGEHGKALVPGKPQASLMLNMIKGTVKPRMPKGKPPLSAAEQKKISAWIATGAKK